MRSFTGNRLAWSLSILCVAQFVVVLDATAATGALPAMGRELRFSAVGLQWVVTAYTLAFGGLLIAGGRIGDILGARRVFVIGMAGFTAASLACGLATTPAWLLSARVAQGMAAALLSPSALSLLTTITGDGRARRRAVGVWTAAAAGGGALGWLVGGVLTAYAGWRWVFLLNLPIGLLTLLLVRPALPRLAPQRALRLDVGGTAGVTAGVGLVVFGLTRVTEIAAAPLLSVAPLLAGAAILLLVARWERRAPDPLLPPALLRSAELRGANLVAAAITGSTTPAMFLAVLYAQNVLGLSPARAALYFPALNLSVIVGSVTGPRLLARIGARWSAIGGLAAVLAGTAVLSTLPSHGMPNARLVSAFVLMGVGLGVASVASTTVGTTAAPDDVRGVASGLLNATAQLGTAVGLAVIIPLAGASGVTDPAAAVHQMRVGFIGAGAIAALGMVAGRLLLPGRAEHPARPLGSRGAVHSPAP